jgi:hypothetical protein
MRGRQTTLVPAVTVGAIALIIGVPALLGMDPREAGALGAPHFVEEAEAAGIAHRYDGEFTYFVGGGVAVLDCDGDGRQDLYLAGGAERAALYRNRSEVGGALRFEPVPSEITDLAAVTGAYPLDIDGDGVEDLAVLRVGEDVLLRGRGDCAFERANERWGFDGGDDWTTAFSATWEGDGLPTLAFGNYLELDTDGTPTDDYACSDNQLVRPSDTGETFASAIALTPSYCTLSMLFSDWDRSGRRDLRVSNDRHYYRDGEEQLWRVDPDERPRQWTGADGWQRVRVQGMGIASQDLTGDGYPEVFLTSQADNKLQALADGPGQPRYEDIALSHGATAHRPYTGDTSLPSTAWHAEFADVNNDGFVDLYVAKGNVEAQPDFAARDPNNLLPDNRMGRSWRARQTRASRSSPGPGARRWPTSTWTASSTWWRSTDARTSASGATSAPATPMIRRRWATGSASDSSRTARTATPSARGWMSPSAIGPSAAR